MRQHQTPNMQQEMTSAQLVMQMGASYGQVGTQQVVHLNVVCFHRRNKKFSAETFALVI